jgi:pilus assembly protein Flp/PilA
MLTLLRNFAADESGATAIEYGLFTAVFAAGLMTAFNALGQSLDTIFDLASAPLDVDKSGAVVAVVTPIDPV